MATEAIEARQYLLVALHTSTGAAAIAAVRRGGLVDDAQLREEMSDVEVIALAKAVAHELHRRYPEIFRSPDADFR